MQNHNSAKALRLLRTGNHLTTLFFSIFKPKHNIATVSTPLEPTWNTGKFFRESLELAFSLDTDSFLNANFRMASHRGLTKDVVSDNGTNFVGESNELKELEALDKKKIQDTTSYGVNWHFNPPLAPHFSGVPEIMIRLQRRLFTLSWALQTSQMRNF